MRTNVDVFTWADEILLVYTRLHKLGNIFHEKILQRTLCTRHDLSILNILLPSFQVRQKRFESWRFER